MLLLLLLLAVTEEEAEIEVERFGRRVVSRSASSFARPLSALRSMRCGITMASIATPSRKTLPGRM